MKEVGEVGEAEGGAGSGEPAEEARAATGKERRAGIVLLVGAAVLLPLALLDPLEGMRERRDEVDVHVTGLFLLPICLVYGLAYALSPARAVALLGSRTRPTTLGWSVLVVLGVLGGLLVLWVKLELWDKGYR